MGDGRERDSTTGEEGRTSETFTATSPDPQSAAPPVDVATGMPRREFLKRTTIVGGGLAVWQGLLREEPAAAVEQSPTVPGIVGPTVAVRLRVNGSDYQLRLEPRMTLLDALRDGLGLTGTKKTCDRGECGACTVHVEGPVQAAFIEHDGFQCGFCTSGQIMSGVAVIEEAKRGWPSAATTNVRRKLTLADLSDVEIRERMSGNLCRCACYPNIVAAIAQAARRG